jgi:hypothetical protein
MAATWRAVSGVFSEDLTMMQLPENDTKFRMDRVQCEVGKLMPTASNGRSELPDEHENGGVPGNDGAGHTVGFVAGEVHEAGLVHHNLAVDLNDGQKCLRWE